VRFAAGLLVVAGVLLSVYASWAFVLLAGFGGAGLVYASVTDTCAMGMLIARLPWNRARAAGGGGHCCEDGRQAEEG
jgi:hypothetical protein